MTRQQAVRPGELGVHSARDRGARPIRVRDRTHRSPSFRMSPVWRRRPSCRLTQR